MKELNVDSKAECNLAHETKTNRRNAHAIFYVYRTMVHVDRIT